MKKLIYNEVARCQPASLRKKLFYTFSFTYFVFIFSERVCEYNFFQRKVVLLVIYLFNRDSFKPTIFTIFLLIMSFQVLLSAVSCNIKLFALCFGLCIKPGIQEQGTECGERGEWGECYIQGNVAKNSGECRKKFRGK